jgi:hypothetical protein
VDGARVGATKPSLHSDGPLKPCLRGWLHVAHLVDRHARILTLHGFKAKGVVMCLKGRTCCPLCASVFCCYRDVDVCFRTPTPTPTTPAAKQPQHSRRADAASEILQQQQLARNGASIGHPCVRVLSTRCPLADPGDLKQAEGRHSEHRTLRDYTALATFFRAAVTFPQSLLLRSTSRTDRGRSIANTRLSRPKQPRAIYL